MQVWHNKFLHVARFYYADIQTGRLYPNDCNVSETYNQSSFGRLDRLISMLMSYKIVTYIWEGSGGKIAYNMHQITYGYEECCYLTLYKENQQSVCITDCITFTEPLLFPFETNSSTHTVCVSFMTPIVTNCMAVTHLT